MKDRIVGIIKNYLANEYGNEDALPKPVLNGLAEAIDERRYEIYEAVRKEYLMEDIIGIENDLEEELTDDEFSIVINRFEKYDNGNMDLLWDIVNDVVSDRKREEK